MNEKPLTEWLEKASSGPHKSQCKKGFESHIPKWPAIVSKSCNDATKNNLRRWKGRPSLIPILKSLKRSEKSNVIAESPLESEEMCIVEKSDESQGFPTKQGKENGPSEEVKLKDAMDSLFVTETEFKEVENLEIEISSVSLKSYVTAIDIKDEALKGSGYSNTSMKSQHSVYVDAEDLSSPFRFEHEILKEKIGKDKKESKGQERGIQTLYEKLKSTGPMFDSFKSLREKNVRDNTSREDWQKFSVQQCYDITVEEIADIWKNMMGLISSLKESAIKFIEKKEANSLDRDHVILEGEMVQLAIDFAINYSKLKIDFLIKSVGERLGVGNLTKSKLKGLLDSKTFAALCNDDDLDTMSRAIKHLSTNTYPEEDLEV